MVVGDTEAGNMVAVDTEAGNMDHMGQTMKTPILAMLATLLPAPTVRQAIHITPSSVNNAGLPYLPRIAANVEPIYRRT